MDEDPIERLPAEKTPEAAARLRDLAETTADKETRRAARRALYRLSQMGIAPPERAPDAQPAQKPAESPDRLRVYASAFDGAGNRLLFFVVADPDGGSPALAQILINDEGGVRDFSSQKMTRREVTERIGRFEESLARGLALAEIESDYGRWLLAEARAINQRQSRTTPPGLLDWLPRIGEPRASYVKSPVYGRLDADTVRADPALARAPADLFALPWLEPWFFAADDTLPWLDQWEQAEGGLVAQSEAVREDRRERLLTEMVAVLMPEDVRARYVRRLEETADILHRRGEETAAKQALYHALALSEAVPIPESPFARAIMRRTIEAARDLVRSQNP